MAFNMAFSTISTPITSLARYAFKLSVPTPQYKSNTVSSSFILFDTSLNKILAI